jgi:hypothetical protein
MSGASAAASDGGLSGSPAASWAQSSAQAQQRWTGSTPLKVTWAVLEAITVAAFCAGAIASGSLVAAVIVPVALIPLAIVSWYRFWRTSVELTADGTVVVRTVLRTHHIPVVQIFRMRRSEYGIRITLIDGRIVTAGVLQTGLWRRRSSRPDQAASAISAITRAIEAARSAQPAETTAAINSSAPVRIKRMIRRLIVTAVAGPAILIASFFVPAAGINLDGRLRWIGVCYTILSLLAAFSLLRFVMPGAGKARRHRRRR